jgi:hypothetical protein
MSGTIWRTLACLCLLGQLAACGGGGSDGKKAQADPPPTIHPDSGSDPGPILASNVTLTTTLTGSGSVVSSAAGVSCTATNDHCDHEVPSSTSVTLTATPASGYDFSSWGGACSGNGTCTVTMSQARQVSANFVAVTAGGCSIARGSPTASPTFASAHPKVLLNQAATLSCLQQLLATRATSATRFQAYVKSEVDRPGNNWGFQYWHAALMYQVTGDAQYADLAVTKVDALVQAEEARIAAGQQPIVANDSYLDIGQLVGDVALVYDWCHGRLSADQRRRWIAYMNQSVWNVWNHNQAFWGVSPHVTARPWSGWSVNNPSNNYYYSFLRATMLVGLATRGENDSAQGWLDQFRTVKIKNELIPLFNRDLQGGGSREGTGYGTAMKGLFQLYDWWERSTGERIATGTSHTLSSMPWLLHNIVPTQDFLTATGDQARDSSVALFDYHREYLLSLISLFPQERMSSMAKLVLDGSSTPQMAYGFELFADYLYQPPAALPSALLADLSPTYWGSGTGQLLMRSAWGDRTAAFSSLACGPFTESHAHRDQGAFQIYRGEWLAPTNNIYTHSGIDQQEELNNLVRIRLNGSTVRQVVGAPQCNLAALADNDTYTYALAKVTPVYNGHAAVSKVEREYLFIKPATFIVFDRVASSTGSSRIWTLNLPHAPVVQGDHLTYNGGHSNRLDVYRAAPSGLSYQVLPTTLSEPTDTLTNTEAKRVDVVDSAGGQSNFLHVLGTNGSVSAVTRSDATGQTGAQITLADGRSVTVRFSNTGTGGTLDVLRSSGGSQVTGALPTSVVPPPLFRN